MPKQNRATPFGEIIATPARGTLMGNRGCLHNSRQQIVRQHRGKRWIICVLHFKNRHRAIMTPGQYTELFFLDEATALAAGHRPCAECSLARFELFRTHWAKANNASTDSSFPLAHEIDDVLHRERTAPTEPKAVYQEILAALPDGSFVAFHDNQPYLWREKALLAWNPEGYRRVESRPADGIVRVLTPPSIVKTFAQGYVPEIHASAFQKL